VSKGSGEEPEVDVRAVPSLLVSWEYLLFVYLIFTVILMWFVIGSMLTSQPESFLGLPKPIAGAIIISLTWIIANLVIASAYYLYMNRRIRELREAGG